ncbi:MAG: hypothetical protein AVDCRST_MAG79-1315, partial [uncultured Thermoleophilia bacterium]
EKRRPRPTLTVGRGRRPRLPALDPPGRRGQGGERAEHGV